MTDIVNVECTVWLVRDSFGNEATGVVEETCDTVQVCGMVGKEGGHEYFESECYHLESWCKEHGFSFWTRSVPLSIPLDQMVKCV